MNTDIIAASCDKVFPIDTFSTSCNDVVTNGSVVDRAVHTLAAAKPDDAFFVADLGVVTRQFLRFKRCLPRIHPFFAIKCNPNEGVIRTLLALGAGFDCASKGEIDQVLALGASADRLIYANPCKHPSHIKSAAAAGVHLMTFDNHNELLKIKGANPNAKVVLRIKTEDGHAKQGFSAKFGADLALVPQLLQLAKDLALDLVGVSFHVGTGCTDPNAYLLAVRAARTVFDDAARFGFDLSLLDVGGGFPGDADSNDFEAIAAVLGPAVDDLFPSTIKVIAEPGRYFVASAFTLAVAVTSVRDCNSLAARPSTPSMSSLNGCDSDGDSGGVASTTITPRSASPFLEAACGSSFSDVDTETSSSLMSSPAFEAQHKVPLAAAVSSTDAKVMYYLNDGVYGSLNCVMFDSVVPVPRVLTRNGVPCDGAAATTDLHVATLWGPTCDSLDCINRAVLLPQLAVGDWLCFDKMGAYTIAAATSFNGFATATVHYVNSHVNTDM